MYPTGPGFPFGEEGGAGEPRAPPPGYPGAGQMPRMHGPMPGNGERWPQQQMVRPPHPGQVRPGKSKILLFFVDLTFSLPLTDILRNPLLYAGNCILVGNGVGI